MTAPHQPDRIAALDGVRGLAILLVLLMHCLYIAPLVGVDIGAHPYARIAMLGWSGVDVFFVLSGFLIDVFNIFSYLSLFGLNSNQKSPSI